MDGWVDGWMDRLERAINIELILKRPVSKEVAQMVLEEIALVLCGARKPNIF